MGLIKCPECGKEISDSAQSCPNCGYPIKKTIAEDNPVESSTLEPVPSKSVKKPKGCLGGCLVVFFVFVLLGFVFYMIGSQATKTRKSASGTKTESVSKTESLDTSDSSADKKEIAGKFDETVWDMVIQVMKANNNLMQVMNGYANSQVSELDFYNTCKEVSDYCSKAYVSFPKGESEDEKSYVESCKTFTLYVQSSSDSLKKYIDSKATKDLSKAQENIDSTQQAVSIVANNRGVFLANAGFSDEEIKELTDKIDEQLK